jgi:hypothetical protein
MDRVINWAGAIPLETDLLNTNKNTMEALGYLAQAILGSSKIFDGLACTPTSPASLQVNIGVGSCYALAAADASAYSSLAADTTQILKQGILGSSILLTCAAPSTTGYSINYLIQAEYADSDSGSTVLPYYNSSNPSVAYSGPGNSGAANYTVRKGTISINAKAGAAATTGTQTTPSPDPGYTGLYVVTVANGATTIGSGNISFALNAPFIGVKLPLIPTLIRTRLTANTSYYVSTSGSDSTGNGSSGLPWATIQNAVNYVQDNIDLNGFTATINVADGTYSPFSVSEPLVGPGLLQVTGDIANPDNCIISASGAADCIVAVYGATVSVSGFKLIGSSGNGLHASYGGTIMVSGSMDFGAIGNAQIDSDGIGSSIIITSPYKISGSASYHLATFYGGHIVVGAVALTLTGTPAYSVGFAATVGGGGLIQCSAVSFSGSATGPKYNSSLNGVINTNGQGTSYFPGSTAGSTPTGGQYA